MAQSKVDVSNIALNMIGAKRISTFTQDCPEARSISAVYEDIRDEVLCEHPWTFAQERVILATLATPPIFTDDRMTIAYAKPVDFLKIEAVNDLSAVVKVEREGIFSDTTSLKMRYTFRNDDPTTYFPKFTLALACRLAAEVCFNLTESFQKSEGLMDLYIKIKLPSAISEDSKQGTPIQANMDEWTGARIYGNAAIAPQTPNAATWSPPW